MPLTDVQLPAEALEEAAETLRSGWLSSGPRVERFERDVSDYVGVEHAVACASGTAALQIALVALGIGPGDEVVTPALTFVAIANVIRLCGARPVFADVTGEDDLTLDPQSVEQAIGPRTRAIVPMHYGGWPCDPALVELARHRGLALVEDAAHALGARGNPGSCGSWGAVGCYSFFANKNLPLGEGGMLVTNDPELAAAARRLRSHGMTSGTWERHGQGGAGYDVRSLGFNARLDEVRAAMGSAMLPHLDQANERRRKAVERYRARLDAVSGVRVPFSARPSGETAAAHLMVVLLDDDRDRLAAGLAERGIQTSVHYRPIHLLTAHSGKGNGEDLERTEELSRRLLTLPLFPHISPEQVDAVCDALEELLGAAA